VFLHSNADERRRPRGDQTMSTVRSATYDYPSILADSERVAWRVEDLIGPGRELDFGKPMLPEGLARVQGLEMLSEGERLLLNQIRAHGYLCTFGLVEEFILPFVLDHARPRLRDDDHRVRAFLGFAAEEAKHIHLFKRFRDEFRAGFGHECKTIGPAEAIAEKVLSHHPLAVALATLQIEWMTQRHWLEGARDDQGLDPQFKSLLKHHWMEEAQHAKLDTLMVEALAQDLGAEEIERAVGEYLEIGAFLDAGLEQQAAFDLEALAAATGRSVNDDERAEILRVQRQALRWTFLGSGMTHERFEESLAGLGAAAAARVRAVAPSFC
jgi:hypothetical protein